MLTNEGCPGLARVLLHKRPTLTFLYHINSSRHLHTSMNHSSESSHKPQAGPNTPPAPNSTKLMPSTFHPYSPILPIHTALKPTNLSGSPLPTPHVPLPPLHTSSSCSSTRQCSSSCAALSCSDSSSLSPSMPLPGSLPSCPWLRTEPVRIRRTHRAHGLGCEERLSLLSCAPRMLGQLHKLPAKVGNPVALANSSVPGQQAVPDDRLNTSTVRDDSRECLGLAGSEEPERWLGR